MSDHNAVVKRAALTVIGGLILVVGGFAPQKSNIAAAENFLTAFSPPVSTDYLANPGIGWQEAHSLHAPLLPETIPYRRPQYSWAAQNEAAGQFDFSQIEADLAAAAAEGGQLSFRVYTMRGEDAGHQIPQWALDQGATLLPNGEPDYSNCVYQEKWGDFVGEMQNHFDGDERIAFIDISGYGNYNEWSWQNQTVWEADFANPISLDGQARQRLADMFIGGSGAVDCRQPNGNITTVNYSYEGFQHSQLVMPYAGIQASSRYVASRRPDVGIRHDCLGSTQHTDDMMRKIGNVIEATWRHAPIVYEFCRANASSAGFSQFIDQADAILQQTHGSIVHDNTHGSRDAGMFADLLRFAGYRYGLAQVRFPQTVQNGNDLYVEMDWQNIGYAPAYAGMGQQFELRLYLLDAKGALQGSGRQKAMSTIGCRQRLLAKCPPPMK